MRGGLTPGAAELARSAVSSCGLGRAVAVGGHAEEIAIAMRQFGCEAVARPVVSELQDVDGVCTVVVVAPADSGLAHVVDLCGRRGTRNLYLVFCGVEDSARLRELWETKAFAAGFRKHPCYYRIADYELLDQPQQCVQMLFERIPSDALEQFPLEQLQSNRQLHMDMLREVGRRGDAHCVRYQKAADYIRPGDVVLDLACGYGYGSHILYHNSQAASVLGLDLESVAIDYANACYAQSDSVRFEAADAQNLKALPDASIDFIASFETIEHLPDPDAYLSELRRVLRPSGRVMICAPNDWSDETGQDPNPHHLHVYTWQRLRAEVGARFLLERGFVQTAGGAMKLHHSPRDWHEVSIDDLDRDAEWIVLLGMATPIGAASVPYVETSWDLPQDDGFHVSAFARDYQNPWLLRSMVTRGMRMENRQELATLQEQVIAASGVETADHGAALCGRAYELLERGAGGALGVSEQVPSYADMQLAIDHYVAVSVSGPHHLRWQVSLLFVGGELFLQVGDRSAAKRRYEACAAIDVMVYSPLLGNKTADARFRLAMMLVADDEIAAARAHLLQTIAEVTRLVSGSWLNVIGDPLRPLPFGPAELAQLLDRASRAAYALRELDSARGRPGVFVREAAGYFERLMAFQQERVTSLRRDATASAVRIADLEQRLSLMAKDLVATEARTHELGAEVVKCDARAQELAAEVVKHDAHAQELAAEVRKHQGASEQLVIESARGWWSRLFRRRT